MDGGVAILLRQGKGTMHYRAMPTTVAQEIRAVGAERDGAVEIAIGLRNAPQIAQRRAARRQNEGKIGFDFQGRIEIGERRGGLTETQMR